MKKDQIPKGAEGPGEKRERAEGPGAERPGAEEDRDGTDSEGPD